jgi:DnaJ-class molecular chaperone
MSFTHLLFIKRLHRSKILMTIQELNMRNLCTKCNGNGVIRIQLEDGKVIHVQCDSCSGYGDFEDESD